MTEQVGLTQLVGSWRLVSLGMTYEDTKERIEHYGPHPTGYMVLSPNGRIIFLFTRADRTAPQTDADRATLFSAMTAYTGRVRIEAEDRFVITVDLAWDPGWTGEQNSIFHPGGGPAEDPDTGTDASANGRPAVRRRFGVGARDVISTKVLVAYLRIALVVFCVHFPIGRKTKLWRSVRDRSLARNGTVVLRPRPLLSGLPKIQTETLPRRCPNECRIPHGDRLQYDNAAPTGVTVRTPPFLKRLRACGAKPNSDLWSVRRWSKRSPIHARPSTKLRHEPARPLQPVH